MKKRWSIALFIISVVALVLRFVPEFLGKTLIRDFVFLMALACLFGLRGKGKVRKYYYIVMGLVGFFIVWNIAMTLWHKQITADPMWIYEGGVSAAIYRFVTRGGVIVSVLKGLVAVQWVLYVIIIILERRPINWMLLGWVISIVISPLIFNLATPYFRDHGYTFATMMWELRNSLTVAIRCLWMVGAIIMAVVELKQMGSRQRRAS